MQRERKIEKSSKKYLTKAKSCDIIEKLLLYRRTGQRWGGTERRCIFGKGDKSSCGIGRRSLENQGDKPISNLFKEPRSPFQVLIFKQYESKISHSKDQYTPEQEENKLKDRTVIQTIDSPHPIILDNFLFQLRHSLL